MALSETWFIEGYLDFELQKYRLLSYLQEVNRYFNETKLYPQLSDVIFHYNNLTTFRNTKHLMQDRFPRQLDHINLEKLELVYRKMLEDDEAMQELEHIISYAMEQLKPAISNGTEIYDFIEQHLRLEPVGILPLYKNEGYLLLRYGPRPETKAYSYTLTLFEEKAARFKGIRMEYLNSWTASVAHTCEYIKREIIRAKPELPQPAVYFVETPLKVPLQETLLPIAKRALVRSISQECNP